MTSESGQRGDDPPDAVFRSRFTGVIVMTQGPSLPYAAEMQSPLEMPAEM